MEKKFNMVVTLTNGKVLRHYDLTLRMAAAMKRHYQEKYPNTLEEIETVYAGTDRRAEALCYYMEEDEEYNNPTAFYERYGW